MDWARLPVFLLASLVLALTPGPDIIYVLTRGMTQGRRVGIAAAAGMCSGIIGHTALAAVGLSSLLLASTTAYEVVRYVGGAYLVYLGVRAFMDKTGFSLNSDRSMATTRTVYWQSVTANLLNPKVALFFLAFLPQFVDVERGAVWLQFGILGVLFMAVTFVVFGTVALMAGTVGEILKHRPGVDRVFRYLAGSILVGLGLKLAWPTWR